jgi:hypothetical protein
MPPTPTSLFLPGHRDDDDDEHEYNENPWSNSCMCKRRRDGKRSKKAWGGGCECPSGVKSQGPIVSAGITIGWQCNCNKNSEKPTKVSVICSK